MRVLHLTDPHLFADRGGELRGVVTFDSLNRVLDHYRQGAWSADYVVATGDLVQDDSVEGYARFADLLGSLDLPVHVVPGNHDVPEHLDAVLGAPPFHVSGQFDTGDWLVVGLDTFAPGRPGGAVSEAEFERLEQNIAGSDAAAVMVCLHHPPVAMGSKWLDSVGLDDGKAVVDRLSRSGRVRVVLFGHVHQAYDAVHAGMRMLATPSTCRQFKPGSDTFAVDDRPPAYRRIELGPGGAFDTELVWL